MERSIPNFAVLALLFLIGVSCLFHLSQNLFHFSQNVRTESRSHYERAVLR